ncbi:MAG: hypothetical protein WCK49_11060, partial [Myxococcaceae bacterium]
FYLNMKMIRWERNYLRALPKPNPNRQKHVGSQKPSFVISFFQTCLMAVFGGFFVLKKYA